MIKTTIERRYFESDLPALIKANIYLLDTVNEMIDLAIKNGYLKNILITDKFVYDYLLQEVNSGFLKVENEITTKFDTSKFIDMQIRKTDFNRLELTDYSLKELNEVTEALDKKGYDYTLTYNFKKFVVIDIVDNVAISGYIRIGEFCNSRNIKLKDRSYLDKIDKNKYSTSIDTFTQNIELTSILPYMSDLVGIRF